MVIKIKDKIASVIVCMILICISAQIVSANSNYKGVAEISMQQIVKVESGIPDNKKVDYQFVSLETGNPMPEGSKNNVYDFAVEDDGKVSMFITYTAPGVYRYQLSTNVKSNEIGYTYAEEKYDVEVYVRNNSQGSLSTDIIVKNKEGEKVTDMLFNHSYRGKNNSTLSMNKTPSVNKTSFIKTGDENPIMIWGVIAFGAFTILILGVTRNRKKKIKKLHNR